MRLWLLSIRNRWQGIGAAVLAALALLLIALVYWSSSDFAVRLLGNADAPRAAAAHGPSGTMLPRSGDSQPGSSLLTSDSSILDTPAPADAGPQTVADAQAAWSANEIAERQQVLLSAINCARAQQKLPIMTLDPQLSETAGAAWLKLAHDPSFSLMNLPGHYQLRSIVPLAAGAPGTVGAPEEALQDTHGSGASACSVAEFDAASLPAVSGATQIGIAVFPPQASWDMASAVILVK